MPRFTYHWNAFPSIGWAAVCALPLLFTGSSQGFSQGAVYKSEKHDVRAVTLAKGLSNPWGMAFLPDGGILVTEREGTLRLVKDGKLVAEPVKNVPKVVARGQGGLLDVALHPKFSENSLVYLSYAGGESGSVNTELARAKFDGKSLTDVEVIFRAEPKTSGANHYGGRILFLADGTLLLSLGDRYGQMKKAQTLDNHLGKIVRLNEDGSVPPDNPLRGNDGAKPEIYTYGHRNVQGLAVRPGTTEIWENEFGPRGGDELNKLTPGANYGWPAITYGVDYSGAVISDKTEAPDMEQPVFQWTPSISPSGMTFYDGDKFDGWKGDLLIGTLSGSHLRRLTLDGNKVTAQEELVEKLGERIRDVAQGPDGFIYIVTDDPSDGKLIRLEPAS